MNSLIAPAPERQREEALLLGDQISPLPRGRWWYVLRYHRPSQLAMRAIARLRRRARAFGLGLPKTPPSLVKRETNALDNMLGRRLAERPLQAHRYQRAGHRVCVLNREHVFGDSIDWSCQRVPDVTRLWKFHLHSHEFLTELLVDGQGEKQACVFWSVICDWIENNLPRDPEIFDDAWHPYCISRRLPVWMMAWATHPPSTEVSRIVFESMLLQLTFLERNLEWDLRGNHLLENLAALALGAVFVAGPAADRWGDRSSRLLRRQLEEQILDHGEHFERSPMYHARMLQVILDVRDATRQLRPELSAICDATARRMALWLEAIRHPDGGIPLLSDSAVDQTPACLPLIQRARGGTGTAQQGTSLNSPRAEFHGTAWTWRDGPDFLLFDTGPVAADELPAHAHNDLLTIEASLGGQRLIVDSGTYDYGEGSMRAYCRSTRAHNTLQVDGLEQCDLWSRFRMGYRGWPSSVECGRTAEFSWCRATHNALRRGRVPETGRWLACRVGGPWICVDWVRGKGQRHLTHWLHLHPDVDVEQIAPDEIRVMIGTRRCRLRYHTPGKLVLERGFYCPEFGVRLEAPVVKWTAQAQLPSNVAWSLEWSDAPSDITVTPADGDTEIIWHQGSKTVRLQPMN